MNKKVFIIAACLVLFLFAAGSVFAQPIRSARLKIVSNVPGAQVFVDGRAVGRTPMEVRVPLGRHTVRVTAAGYDDFERTMDVRRDEGIQANLNRLRREFTLSIQANVPQAEVLKYAPDLRSMTAGRGMFTMNFSHYEEVPGQIQEKIVEASKAEQK